ncbi:MAG TPA: hypothetical protein VGX25_02530 [Actinophytocola sp.]|uniref:hypothetical protein n=1 Tax=Actinophytocola sp. TaxID=1872138 RepID=UPI002DDDB97E|nr:hypothetical protein [Actinophytocola sp.]HEV2778253.1 hypothetical protein [Actinophytocola sp.]
MIKALLFGAATITIYARGHRTLAIVFVILVAANVITSRSSAAPPTPLTNQHRITRVRVSTDDQLL